MKHLASEERKRSVNDDVNPGGRTPPTRLELADAEILFWPTFFTRDESDAFLRELLDHIDWRRERIRLFGQARDVPRLVAWHGDPGKTYRYSGITHQPEPWTPTLRAIKARIEPVSGVTFNSVLLNLYRNERDSMGWHSDDEPELGVNPVIGSVSLGATRAFRLRHKRDQQQKLAIELPHGSYLLMRGPTQHHWLHHVPKSTQPRGPRINLTFRVIRS